MQQQVVSVPKKQQQAAAAEWAEHFECQVEERAKKAADAQAKHRAEKGAKEVAQYAFSFIQSNLSVPAWMATDACAEYYARKAFKEAARQPIQISHPLSSRCPCCKEALILARSVTERSSHKAPAFCECSRRPE